jgi:hypothetical protein
MNPNLPYAPESSADPVQYAIYPPAAAADRAVPAEASGNGTTPVSHKGHHWMHLLMCAPMLLVVGYLVLTGRAGGGSIFYAVGCMAMMGVMMLMMGRMGGGGSDDHSSGPHR